MIRAVAIASLGAVALAAEGLTPLPPTPAPLAVQTCPATCKVWHDGCNDCVCDGSKLGSCTKRACLTTSAPQCSVWDCNTREIWSPAKVAYCQDNMKCSGGMVFKECGSSCVSTCTDPHPICTKQCVPKCECPTGMVFNDGVCISESSCAVTDPVKEEEWPPAVGWFNSSGHGSLFVTKAQEGPILCQAGFEPVCVQVESCTRDAAGKVFVRCPQKQVAFDGVIYKTVIRKCECQRKAQCAGGQVFSSCASACDGTCHDPRPICTKGCYAKCTCPTSIANPNPVLHDGKCVDAMQCPSENRCTGGQVWKTCGSICTPSCLHPAPLCAKRCVARCECPAGQVWHGGKCAAAATCPALTPNPKNEQEKCHCLSAAVLDGGDKQYGVCKRHFKEDKEAWCYVGACGKALNFRPYRDMYVKYNCEQEACPCLGGAYPDLGALGSCGQHHSLDIAMHGLRAKHWCYVGACGKARGYEEAQVKFADDRATFGNYTNYTKTLYIRTDCHVTHAPTPAPTPAPPTPAPTAAPTTAPTPQPKHVILPVSVHYQAAKGPYQSWGVGTTNRVLSERDCNDRCMLIKDCKFGTFIRSGGTGTAAGECWLSATSFSASDKLRECGVPCLSFKKEAFSGTHQDQISMVPTEVAPVYPMERCQCKPRLHPSLLTTCHDNPFSHVTRVRHISARFHTIPLEGGETHRCRWLRTDPNMPHTHTMIMQDFKDALIPGVNVTGGVMKARPPFVEVVRHIPGRAECMALCGRNPDCMYATFMQGITGNGHTRSITMNGKWVSLTYHTCYMSKVTYLEDHPTYGPVCAGCDNFAKVKCHGCDRKGYDCKCCDCHRDGSPINVVKTGFGAFAAKAPWLHEGIQNVKAKYADCATQCSTDPACKVGTYMANGECWLSSFGHVLSAGVCDGPCYSFTKTHDAEGEVIAVSNAAA